MGADGETPFYKFETVSLAPIDLRLVNTALLTQDELDWLNDYHAEVYRKISPHLDADTKQWLEAATRPLKKSPDLMARNDNPGQNRKPGSGGSLSLG